MIPQATSLRAAQIAARLTRPPTRLTSKDGTPIAFTISVGGHCFLATTTQ